jgi:phosphoserine phosphatase
MIVSGGFRNAIRPLADHLGIERIEAVDLHFAEDGSYVGFDETYPTTRSGGKPEIVQRLRAELRPSAVVMVGDGVSDLEAKPAADLFVGFGRYVTRERVRREADHFINSLADLPGLLARWA